MIEKIQRNMVISLIGRPNVGKSSLFNRLMKKSTKALTYDRPGVTRDRHYGFATFDDARGEDPQDIILVDTGGFYPQKLEESKGNGLHMNEEQIYNKFFNIMTEHAELAIKESDLVLLVVDVREGILPSDKVIADFIRKCKKDFLVVCNKFDSDSQFGQEIDAYTLGIDGDQLFTTSAAHGYGVENLREKIHREASLFAAIEQSNPDLQKGVTPRESVVSRVAIIGAPNAGKSTLLNKLLGANRALVSDIPGTTVDPIEGYFDLYFGEDVAKLDEANSKKDFSNQELFEQYEDFRKNNQDVYQKLILSYEEDLLHGKDTVGQYDEDFDDDEISSFEEQNTELEESAYEQKMSELLEDEQDSIEEFEEKGSYWRSLHIVDTAGIRKKGNIHDFIEEQSVYRSLRCISEADIVVYMVDCTKGVGHQDRRLIDIALDKGKSVIICLNKFDLFKGKFANDKERREWLLDLRAEIPWLNYCDIIPISAKYGKSIGRLKQVIKKTIFIRSQKVSAGHLNRFIFDVMDHHGIVVKKSRGQRLKVKYASMIKSAPPTFLLYTNKSKGIPETYKRYLKNCIRQEYGIINTPVHLIFRTGTDLEKRMAKVKRK